MSHPKKIIALALAMAWPILAQALTAAPVAPAAAAPPPPAAEAPSDSMGNPTIAREIKNINEQMMLLRARLEQVTLELQLGQKVQEKARMSGASAPGLNGSDQPPTVQSIEGIDRKLKAKLSFGNGLTQTVATGDQVNGWLISDITPSTVVISHGKETIRLPFGAEPPPSAPQYPGGANSPIRR